MFVALRPPEPAVDDLDSFLEVRRESAPFRWAPAEQFHLTLAFLADVPDRKLDDLVERLGRAARKRHRLTTRICGGGAFPHPGRARVLWAGLQLDEGDLEELSRLATGARAAATRAGVEVDGQRFRPHLTVARARQPVEASRWVRLLDSYAGPPWESTEVELVASYLGEGPRRRARHEVVAAFPLGSDAPPG
jgi:2'-5' RNA ligase